MGQLSNDNRPVVRAVGFRRFLTGLPDKGGEGFLAVFVEPQLSRICPSFGDDRYCLGPYKARSAGGKPFVSSEGKFARSARGIAVAALHWMDGERIRYGDSAGWAEMDGPGKNRDVLYCINGDIEPACQLSQILDAPQAKLPFRNLGFRS
jgi:hypothetical protein